MIRIGFLGLGGVGGYFGAKLARTYSNDPEIEVVFLAREKTAAAIRANGIKLITPEEEFVTRPSVVATNSAEAGPLRYLIVSVKSYDLESSLAQFRECISPATIILPLLNGIDAEEKIRKWFPGNEIWSGCVYIVSRITAPGVITETGNIHRLHFGGRDANKTAELFRVLKPAHEDVFLHGDIRNIVWEKFVFISTIASLTSYLDVCLGKILEHDNNRTILKHLLEEIIAVAKAENILLPTEIISTTLQKMELLPYETTSSMHSDFRSGSRTEIESLTAHVVELAARHGIATPVYRRILDGLLLRQN